MQEQDPLIINKTNHELIAWHHPLANGIISQRPKITN